MASFESKEPITPEFNNAVGETYLQSQFNEAATDNGIADQSGGEATQTEEVPEQKHDLESDLHSLGGYKDDPELANYQSFADQYEAQQNIDADAFQEFQDEQDAQASENDNESPNMNTGPKNDFDLSM